MIGLVEERKTEEESMMGFGTTYCTQRQRRRTYYLGAYLSTYKQLPCPLIPQQVVRSFRSVHPPHPAAATSNQFTSALMQLAHPIWMTERSGCS